jgi:dTDP-4-amino-4,6-dideoxygalactose transaminase
MERLGFKVGDFYHCERISQRTVSLPFFTDMVEDEVRLVCETLARGLTEII